MSEREEDLEALRNLPSDDVDDARRRRIRRLAHQELATSSSGWWSTLERFYTRRLEPTLVTGVGAAYLFWAVASVAGLTG